MEVSISLPIFQTLSDIVSGKDFSLLQTNWSALINPIIDRIQNRSNLLLVVPLAVGNNVVNHKLGKKLTGWSVIGQDAKASIYDAQSTNQTPELTLVLISDAIVNVRLEVF